MKLVLGENREDLQKKDCRRSARHQQLLNPVLGERNEDLHEKKSHHKQRSAPQSAQKCVPEKHADAVVPCIWEENQEDLPETPRPEAGMSTICSSYRTVSREKNLLTSTSISKLRNWNVDVLLEDEERREHFHQLFRYLRLRSQGAERDRRRGMILGTSIISSGTWQVAIRKISGAQDVFLKVPDLRILFHQQRHGNIGIENLHDGADFGKMLHAVPLHTILPASDLR